MDGGKTKEMLLHELIRMQKDIERKVEAQERFIARFQLLVQYDGLFSQIMDSLPFPVAIFELSGVVRMANHMLMEQAKLNTAVLSQGNVNLLDRVTDENYGVFEAAENTHLGETTLVKNMATPLSLFSADQTEDFSDPYHTAIFFPVADDGDIRYGAVMLME